MTRWGILLVLFLLLAAPPTADAGDLRDEITGAIIDVDPRLPLTSGTGAAYDSAYAPADEPADPTQTPSLRGAYRYRYGQALQGLRNPWYEAEGEALSSPEDDPFAPLTEPVPLGKPYQRDGVFYQDDLDR